MDTLAVTLTDVDLGILAGDVLKGAAEAASDKGLSLEASCDRTVVRAQRDMLATVAQPRQQRDQVHAARRHHHGRRPA